LRSYITLCKNSTVKKYVNTPVQSVLLIGGAIFVGFTFLKSIDLLFSMTALCVVSVYGMSMIQLLTMKHEWRSGQNIITLAGLVTAAVIWWFALEGVIAQGI
jgi:hypothetical protein